MSVFVFLNTHMRRSTLFSYMYNLVIADSIAGTGKRVETKRALPSDQCRLCIRCQQNATDC